MKHDSSADAIECAHTFLLTDLRNVIEQQEAALLALETAVTEKRWALVNAEPAKVLETVQRVETGLARLEQLEAARTRLSSRLAAGAEGLPSVGIANPSRDRDPSAPAGLLDVQCRILGAIARIAAVNEANGHLVAGLSRTSGLAIERLSQLQEIDSSVGVPGRRDNVVGSRRVTLDLSA